MASDRAMGSTAADARGPGGGPPPAPPANPCTRRLLVPSLVITGVLASGALLAVAPDAVRAAVPPCPFRMLTGWDCPFCGGTRAVLALVHGDVGGAADYNLLVTVAAFLAAGLLAWWAAARLAGTSAWPGLALLRSRAVVIGAAAAVTVFWVVRNLPVLPFLATAT